AKMQLGWHPRWNLNTTLEYIVGWHKNWLSGTDMHEYSITEINNYMNTK
ncbi:CDP-glucose 4,6-dehydratase, partial [Yersinia pestis]